jgi:hypothetical protein
MRNSKVITAALVILFFSCRKKSEDIYLQSFADGFENAQALMDLFPPDASRWTSKHEEPGGGPGHIAVDTSVVHSGSNSLRCAGTPTSGAYVGKSSIIRNNLDLKEGDIVYVSVWYYLEPSANDDQLYLCDLEETTQQGGSPGFRIALYSNGQNSALTLERGKIERSTIYADEQNRIPFPHGQWVHMEYEAKLSQKKKGYFKLWQDGTLMIDVTKVQLLGRDLLMSSHGTTGALDKLEVGITANTTGVNQVLYVDDVEIYKK